MKQLILHIPHSAVNIPFKDGYIVSEDILQSEILKLTDWHTEDLFHSDKDAIIIAPFSRIFCDPERVPDDEQEIMAQQGKDVGDSVRVQIQEDTEERIQETPQLLEDFFSKEKGLKFIFDKMSCTHRKEYIDWLTGAKKRRYITE